MVTIPEAQVVAASLALAAEDPRWRADQRDAYRAAEIKARTILAALETAVGDIASAHANLQRALDLGGDRALALRQALLIPRVAASRAEIVTVRNQLETALRELLDTPPTIADPLAQLPFTAYLLAYHGEMETLPLQRLFHQVLSKAAPSLDWVAPHCQPNAQRRAGLKRVGFISWHLGEHTISRLFGGLMAGIDRSRFEVSVFAFGGHDGAMASLNAIALPENLDGARARIAEAELDVLIYLDLGMDFFTLLLAHSRLAPLQGVLWGHPDTTGLATIDVFFSPACMEPADGDSHYSERLVRLPGPTVLYPRPQTPAGATRVQFGLPEQGVLYLCPQTLQKFHPDFDSILRDILEGCPDSFLVLTPGQNPTRLDVLLNRISQGREDILARIVVLPPYPPEAFRQLFEVCDVALDPLHYSGGNTSLEGLAVGIPIMTWPGRFMRARHTYGFYQLMGEASCIARDREDYVTKAVALGRDKTNRDAVRQRLRIAAACLYDDDQGLVALQNFLCD